MSDPTPEPRRRILDAAVTLFARYGLEKTTLADIASRAHLKKATLYHHFPEGKHSIFSAAVDEIIEARWQAVQTAVRAHEGPVEQLLAYIELRIDTFDREVMVRGIDRDVWGDLKPWIEEAIRSYLVREKAMLTELLEAGMGEGTFRPQDPELGARFLQALLRGITVDGPIETQAASRKREVAELMAFIRRGLFASPPSSER